MKLKSTNIHLSVLNCSQFVKHNKIKTIQVKMRQRSYKLRVYVYDMQYTGYQHLDQCNNGKLKSLNNIIFAEGLEIYESFDGKNKCSFVSSGKLGGMYIKQIIRNITSICLYSRIALTSLIKFYSMSIQLIEFQRVSIRQC